MRQPPAIGFVRMERLALLRRLPPSLPLSGSLGRLLRLARPFNQRMSPAPRSCLQIRRRELVNERSPWSRLDLGLLGLKLRVAGDGIRRIDNAVDDLPSLRLKLNVPEP